MFCLRRNRSFVVKVLLFMPLTWLCVVLYLNSSAKVFQGEPAGHAAEDQIVYVNDNKLPADDVQLVQQQQQQQQDEADVKGPPLRDNQLRKKKPTLSGT